MKYANTINDLICYFIRLDFDESLQSDMAVMERIYPVDYRAYEIEKRELWADVFFDEVKRLHNAGFVHRDIWRPSGIGGQAFDNVLLTHNGIRLIDVGISALLTQVGNKLFEKYIEIEIEEMQKFKI